MANLMSKLTQYNSLKQQQKLTNDVIHNANSQSYQDLSSSYPDANENVNQLDDSTQNINKESNTLLPEITSQQQNNSSVFKQKSENITEDIQFKPKKQPPKVPPKPTIQKTQQFVKPKFRQLDTNELPIAEFQNKIIPRTESDFCCWVSYRLTSLLQDITEAIYELGGQ